MAGTSPAMTSSGSDFPSVRFISIPRSVTRRAVLAAGLSLAAAPVRGDEPVRVSPAEAQ
jgi:hypothetical protein